MRVGIIHLLFNNLLQTLVARAKRNVQSRSFSRALLDEAQRVVGDALHHPGAARGGLQ